MPPSDDLDSRCLASSETSAFGCDGVDYLDAASLPKQAQGCEHLCHGHPDYRIEDPVSCVVDGETVHRVIVRFARFDTDDHAVSFTLQNSWNGWFITAIANNVQDDWPGCGFGFLPCAPSGD